VLLLEGNGSASQAVLQRRRKTMWDQGLSVTGRNGRRRGLCLIPSLQYLLLGLLAHRLSKYAHSAFHGLPYTE